MGVQPRKTYVATTVPDSRPYDTVDSTSHLYHEEARLLVQRITLEEDRRRRIDLLVSLEATVYQAGRCDAVLDLVGWGVVPADSFPVLRFAGTLPSASERRQAERELRAELETLRDLRRTAAAPAPTTRKMRRWNSFWPETSRGAWLIAAGTMLAVACWSYLEGVLLRK